ncbi:MAG: hypothetical protein WC647_10410 [Desulfomonilaceae bacterium]
MSRGMRLFSPWPSSRPISLTRHNLRFMWSQKAMFLHYISKDDKPYFQGYDLVVEKNYDFGSITSSKRRHNVRWALKHCSVERVPFDSLVRESDVLIEDTYQRQGREFNKSVLEMWKNYFRLAELNPLFEAWGAFVSDQMAACHVCIIIDGGAYIEMTFSRTDLLRFHPVDALCFVFTQNAMNRNGITHVSYGRRPITGEAEGLVSFKESMGFRKIPLRERVEINPILKPFLCGPLRPIALNIVEKYSDRSMYARIIAGVTNTLRGQIRHSQEE